MPCMGACPYSVLKVLRLASSDKKELSLGDRLRAMVHGNKQAYAVLPDKCTACGLCVEACMMHAIKLRRKAAG